MGGECHPLISGTPPQDCKGWLGRPRTATIAAGNPNRAAHAVLGRLGAKMTQSSGLTRPGSVAGVGVTVGGPSAGAEGQKLVTAFEPLT